MFIKILQYGFSEGLVKLIPFATVFLFSHLYGLELIGELTLMIVSLEIVFILCLNNLQAVYRIDYFKLNEIALKEQVVHQLLFSLTIWLFIALSLSVYFILLEQEKVYLIALIIPIFRVFNQLLLAYYQCEERSKTYLISQVIFFVTFALVLYITHEHQILSWIYSMLTAAFLQFLVLLLNTKIKLSNKGIKLSLFGIRAVAIKGLIFMPQALGWWLKNGVERYLIGIYFGTSVLGLFALFYQIAAIIVLSMTAINLALVPKLNAALKQYDYQTVRSFYQKSISILLVNTIIVAVFGDWYLNLTQDISNHDFDYILIVLSVFVQSVLMLFINELYFYEMGKTVAKYVLTNFLIQSLCQLLMVNLVANMTIVLAVGLLFILLLLYIVIKCIDESRRELKVQ